jgi:predicted RNase H-like HicB family nuclease
MATAIPADYLKRPYARVVVPESDGTFRGEIIEFPGCIATGLTEAEALANLRDAAESWLLAVVARGQTVPEPMESAGGFSGKTVARLGSDLHRRAAYMAAAEGVSLNQFIVSSVAERIGSRVAALRIASATNVTNFFVNSGGGPTQFLASPPEKTVASTSRASEQVHAGS